MRLSSNKKDVKVIKMKPLPVKKKKLPAAKIPEDTLSETISFVIKGKLTPIKPTYKVVKNVGKILKGKEKINKKQKPAPNKKEVNTVKKTVVQKSKPKPEKKPPGGKDSKPETKVQNAKTAKKTSVQKQQPVKKVPLQANAALPNVIKHDTKLTESKKVAKPTKSRAVKKEPVAVKRVKSPAKPPHETPTTKQIKQEKIDDDIKTKQTIEKLLKQANKALKPPQNKNKTKPKPKQIIKPKAKPPKKVAKNKNEPQVKNNQETTNKSAATDDTYASDELTLEELRQTKLIKQEILDNVLENSKPSKPATAATKPKVKVKSNLLLLKKRALKTSKAKTKKSQESSKSRKLKLYSFWSAPKRHRVASLNALAKVHCLYENETRGNILDATEALNIKKELPLKYLESEDLDSSSEVVPTRTLRSVPGLRGVGKHWDMHESSSSSSEESSERGSPVPVKTVTKIKKEPPSESVEKESRTVIPKTRKRNRTEIVMDLKDMVVRKRMASLNATAILAASYSVEKRGSKSPKDTEDSDSDSESSEEDDNDDSEYEEKKVYEDDSVKKEEDRKVIEVCATPNKKVAVILNQDTDVTITGVYVNSTTRSTHHEGYCSIAGMQYRISATSHTQTAATAVATETLLQSSSSSAQENSSSESMASCKSYTPLDALSNMQPPPGPGIHQGVHPHMGPPQHMPMPPHQLSPGGRRHGCPSAFSTPHSTPPYPPTHATHPASHPQGDSGYPQGYYQPAGPLITVPHGHPQPPLTKSAPLSEPSPTSTSPPLHQAPPPAPSSNGDSSDSEVIITSVTTGKDSVFPQPQQQPPSTYRYSSQYSSGAPHPGYSYPYPPHYYPPGPPTGTYHHDFCYPPYLPHHKYRYGRYLPPAQYYPPNPTELYSAPPPTGPASQNQQVVTATPVSSSSTYQASPSGPPLVESYTGPPLVDYAPPPPHYYPGYPAPPPACYTHSPTRAIPYINATYQSCPCPMQSCPKNVLTGPLTGDSKRSSISSIAKDSMPLPPVALALPLEPASATGPPSPARGSAGMPPPPSPAGATYQPPPPAPKRESISPESSAGEKKRKARVGKAMVRNTIQQQNTMLLMCNPQQNSFDVKREIESPKEKEPPITIVQKKEIISDDESNKSLPEVSDIIVQEPVETKQEPSEILELPPKNQLQSPIELEPCLKTVAENVKVKNMKRKLSLSKEKASEPSPPPVKKQKLEKYPNGSYKDLIKKDTNTVKINNGKRKLIAAQLKAKSIKIKLKPAKRKRNQLKENPGKKFKSSRPTAIMNASAKTTSKKNGNVKELPPTSKCNSSKQIGKNEKGNLKNNGTNRKLQLNNNNSKKLSAVTVLDNLIAKNNVDRTIECVISESVLRTPTTTQEEQQTTKDTSALTINNNNNKTNDKCNNNNNNNKVPKEPLPPPPPHPTNNKKSTNSSKNIKQAKSKQTEVDSPKSVISCRRKSKCKEAVPQVISRVPRRSSHAPRWSNGWMWEGEPFESKVFLNSDETTVVRKCYPAMRHAEGDIIESRDCVLLKAGPRKNDLPFVAKIAYLWENPDDGEMMMSLLWYYRPEHTEQGRLPVDQPDEVFASRHKDSNSVACIDDKCYVLTFNEYCRYKKNLRRLEEAIEEDTSPFIPIPEPYPRSHRQPEHPLRISPEMVFFCRRVYDFRQKRLVKNPS